MAERFTENEVQALADAFHSRVAAGQLLSAAGIPYGDHPSWLTESSLQWWREIDNLLANGRLVDGRRRILDEALRAYPGNAVFAAAIAPPLRGDARLPAGLLALLRMMRRMVDALPKVFRTAHRPTLSGIYVRQSVAVPLEMRRPRERVPEELASHDIGWVEEARRTSALAQPFDDVLNLHDHLVIEGAAGLGKTTLGYQLAGRLAGMLLDSREDTAQPPIPLVVPARVLADSLGRGWEGALREALVTEYGVVPEGAITPAMLAGTVHGIGWFVVVDALDEIPDESSRQRLLAHLATQMSQPDGPARFLVTTRPLPPGETALLAGPQVGFYELQPFDAEALERFASRWFDPDSTARGAVAAREFLDQVATAGLGDVLAVPLLAGAAQVHEADAERPLPGSRYELYERYIDHLAAARRGTPGSPLRQVADARDYLDWLDQYRTELLEAIATGYTSTERPLLDTARDFERGHATPPRVPADRDEVLGGWLSDTGLVSRRGHRLSFLHQTFAEHLTARFRARGLPPTLDPDDPRWEGLLRGLGLDDEASARTFLHYLHRRGPGAQALTWLLRGSLRERDQAAGLVTEGAPCDADQLAAFLSHVKERVVVGVWGAPEIRPLVAPARRAEVRHRLRALLAHESVPPIVKIALVDVIRGRSVHSADQDLVTMLMDWTGSAHPADVRRGAATVLASAGDRARAHATRVLHAMAIDGDEREVDRVEAATALAALGPHHREEAAPALRDLAGAAVEIGVRERVAKELAKLGDSHRRAAAEALRALACDDSEYAWRRVSAAKALSDLGGGYRAEAARLLLQLSEQLGVDSVEQTSALSAAATLDPTRREAALTRLAELAVNPRAAGHSRQEAATELAALGNEARRRAAAALRALALDIGASSWERVEAACEMAKLGRPFLPSAADVLRDLAGEPTIEAQERIRAAEALATCGDDHLAAAVTTLWRVYADRTPSLADRASAASALSALGYTHRRQLMTELERRAEHPVLAPEERVLDGAVRAALEPDRRPAIAALLGEATRDPTLGPAGRLLAASTLRDLGEAHLGAAADQLRAVLASGAASADEYRYSAARDLFSLGVPWREEAAAALLAHAADPTAPTYGRAALRMARDTMSSSAELRATLLRVATDLTDPSAATDALTGIAGLSEQWQERAIQLTCAALDGPFRAERQGWYDYVLRSLRRMGAGGRQAALERLREMPGDPTLRAGDRRSIAQFVIQSDGEAGTTAADLLLASASDPTLEPEERMGAALTAAASPIRRTRAIEVLSGLLSNPFLEGSAPFRVNSDLARQIWHLTGEDSFFRSALEYTLYDPAVPASARRKAAWETAAQGGPQLSRAVAILTRLAGDPAIDADDRAEAAQLIARLGTEYHGTAAAAYAQIATDPFAAADERRRAAWSLASLGASHRPTAVAALASLAADVSISGTERWQAAREATVLGGAPARILGVQARERVGDARRGVVERITAAGICAILDPDGGPLVAGVIEAAANRSDAGGAARLLAADCLVRLGPAYAGRSAALLHALLDEPTTAPAMVLDAAQRCAMLGPDQLVPAGAALLRLARDWAATAVERRNAAGELHSLHRELRPQAAAVLLALASDSASEGSERRAAAWTLAGMGGDEHDRGLEAMAAVATDHTIEARARLEAVWSLAHFPARRVQALNLLATFAQEPGLADTTRVDAAVRLRRFGGPHRTRALAMLRTWADSPVVAPEVRIDAAVAATAHVDEAIPILQRAVADRALPPSDLQVFAWQLGELGATGHAAALATLTRLSTDPGVEPGLRADVLWDLISVDLGHRETATRLLAELVSGETLDPTSRTTAAWNLARIGGEHHHVAAAALDNVATDPTSPGARRQQAAYLRARLNTEFRPSAATMLSLIVADGAVDVDTRAAATSTLRLLGQEYARAPLASLVRTASDPAAAAGERLFAAAATAELSPELEPVVADLVMRIAVDPASSAAIRLQAADQLDGAGRARTARALEVYRSLLVERPAEPSVVMAAARRLAQAGEPDRVRARRALANLARDSVVPSQQRREAAWQLAMTVPEMRTDAAAVFEGLASDPRVDGDERLEAAWCLARLGDGYRDRAYRELAAIAVDPTVDAACRLSTSTRLANAGPHPRRRAIGALARLAHDRSAPAELRVEAAVTLLTFGDTERAGGLRLLSTLADDLALPPHHRALARASGAQTLQAAAAAVDGLDSDPDLPPEHLSDTAAVLRRFQAGDTDAADGILRRILRDQRASGADRCAAALELLPYDSATAGAALAALCADKTVPARTRRAAATDLVPFQEHRALATTTLAELAAAPTEPPHERRQAALDLARCGATARAQARRLLLDLATSSDAGAESRWRAGEDLARLSEGSAGDALSALVALGEEDRHDPRDRLDVLHTLLDLGTPARRAASDLAGRIVARADGGGHPFQLAQATAVQALVDGSQRARALDLLAAAAVHPEVDVASRRDCAMMIADVDRRYADHAADLLGEIAQDTGIRAWERTLTAEMLATFGPGRRGYAVRVLLNLTVDDTADPWERTEAALAVARFDHDRRSAMTELLRRHTDDPGTSADQRVHAAAALLHAGTGPRRQAIRVLQEIAAWRDAAPDIRRQAATTLCGLAGEAFTAGRGSLHEMAADPASAPLDRALALDLLAPWDHRLRDTAATALRDLAADDGRDPADRRTTAIRLVRYGGDDRIAALDTLRTLAAGLPHHPAAMLHRGEGADSSGPTRVGQDVDRLLALAALSTLEPARRVVAVQALRRAVTNPTLTADQRRRVAEALMTAGPDHREHARGVLAELAVEPTSTPSARLAAAANLSG